MPFIGKTKTQERKSRNSVTGELKPLEKMAKERVLKAMEYRGKI
jgi:hypothetical protein